MAAPSKVDDRGADGIELTKELRDPYVVFYDEDVLTPVPDAQPLSSLEEFAAKYLRDKKAMVEAETAPEVQEVQPEEPKEPSGHLRRGPRTMASVVERSMMGGMHTKGPLSILYRAVRDRLRVKVWTRSHTRVRSILTGFVHAYDRHVNLALADVDEVLLLPPAPSLPTGTAEAQATTTATPTAPAPPLPTKLAQQEEEANPSAPAAEPTVLPLPAWATTSGSTDTVPEVEESSSGCPTTTATTSGDTSSSEVRPRRGSPRRRAACIPLESIDVQPESDQEEPAEAPSDPRPSAAESTPVAQKKRPARTGRARRRAAAPTLAPRSRHVNQLFVRGENVVSVALMPV
ncbi:U7 snRNA-associated Sm-like protein LSm11 [Dermacentor silvarum]|uniref:U7 snRNA-associated Sm-like protein LSm11 n=1 Tax=Dermacentor silvarum TaxID=543639 RepID=UPI0018980E1B|nr:U7 snRNA-associated Sm-like protein LSm11 [Dermacentor silvarum]